mgnify:FL=1
MADSISILSNDYYKPKKAVGASVVIRSKPLSIHHCISEGIFTVHTLEVIPEFFRSFNQSGFYDKPNNCNLPR